MTQMTTQDRMSAEHTERQLWKQYEAAVEREYSEQMAYLHRWRAYVRAGLLDEDRGREWGESLTSLKQARERSAAARLAWRQVAFPLYDIALNDDDDTSS